MSSELKIAAEPRTEFGKGAARRIRREDKVPGVLYGHGNDPIHVTLPGHDLMLALKTANALLSIEIEGQKPQLALPKQVQRDPIKGFLEHVDLVIVKRGEKVTVSVPVVLEGEAASETLVTTDFTELEVEAEATHIPEQLVVSIEGLEVGAQVLAKDVELPSGSTLVTDEEALVVNVTNAPTAEEIEAELAEAEAEAGIEHDESDEELAEAAEAEGEAEGESGDAESGDEGGAEGDSEE